jgi:hypothetical protein
MALIAFIAGCASPRPNVNVVANTLQTYRVGKTTFKDFKGDSGLVVRELPKQQSYLNPSPQLEPKTQTVYVVPKGSPWKIYETGQNWSLLNGNFSQSTRFVVGDNDRPISILAFDGKGNLTGISHAP